MRLLTASLTSLLLLLVSPAYGGTLHTFAHDGTCKNRLNWSPATKPTLEDPVLIPAGKALEVKEAACKTGDLTVEGSVKGGPLEVAGDITVEGAGSMEGVLSPVKLYGIGTLSFGSTEAPPLLVQGRDELAEDLDAVSVDINGGLYTNGHDVETYGLYPHIALGVAYLWLGTSTVTTSNFVGYPPLETNQQTSEATFVICQPTRASGGFHQPGDGEGGIFSGGDQEYGNLSLGCTEPVSRESYTIKGTLTIHPTDGPALFARGRVVKASALAGSGMVEAWGLGEGPAVIECGCTPPPGLELGPGVEVR